MEVSMTTAAVEGRGRFWPILFALIGAINIFDYVYKLSFQPSDLLQGLGFLFMVPLAYFHPSAYSFKRNAVRARPGPWAKGLSVLGVALIATEFALRWL